ncbi:MAG: N-acetylmuramic acid 6-phosphate etherase [Planctomycetaceae bacterium]|nr:N-acetylmuramic acid 6-phosphate etherase [Planctomycetaceae bacterium]
MKLPSDRSHVATEQRHDESRALDALGTDDVVLLLARDQRRAVEAVERAAGEIARFADLAAEALRVGGRLVYAGAGTSGRLGVLDASECPPTFRSDPSQVVGIIAGGDSALRRSSEGREDEPEGIAEEFARLGLGAKDVFLGIAAGGTTPYVLGALRLAKERGAGTGLLTCAPHVEPECCDVRIVLATGAEILTGSTRLKAGTATKIALNAITTAMFVRLGKTYGNLMVDLAATNDKLVDRAVRIYREFFPEDSREAAHAQLMAAGGMLKTAIVMRARGVSKIDAERDLAAHDGSLRAVIG